MVRRKTERVIASDPTPTAFQTGVNRVSWLLIRFMLVMAPVVLLINGFTKGDWLEAALFALSIAVGLTPVPFPPGVDTPEDLERAERTYQTQERNRI